MGRGFGAGFRTFQVGFRVLKDPQGPSAGQFNPSQRITPMHPQEPTMTTARTLIARLVAVAAAAVTTLAVLAAVVSLGDPLVDSAQQLATLAAPAIR